MSKPGAGIEAVDLKNKTMSSLGKDGMTSPFGSLDGIDSDDRETRYYVTDNPTGKIYTVNADGTWYATPKIERIDCEGQVQDKRVLVIT